VQIRPFESSDLEALIDLTIATFAPFYEDHVRVLYGDALFQLHHGQWQQDYRDEVAAFHDPEAGRWAAVAEDAGSIVGYIAWKVAPQPDHGEISMLAVLENHRRQQVGRALCRHAMDDLKARDVEVLGLFTGNDAFHAPARGLYESLGFIKVEIAGYIKKI
jgi:ribosomal protein S18 acetylase RimI-like enzyme